MKIKLLFSFICLGFIGSVYSMSETPDEMLLIGAGEINPETERIIKPGDIDIIRKAIAKKANINAKDEFGRTALIIAVLQDNEPIVKLLLDNGANPNLYNDSNDTALLVAARKCYVYIAKSLLDHGANPDLQDESGFTALMWAVRVNFKAIMIQKFLVKLLLDKGADLDIKNKFNQTALDIAKEEKNKDITEQIENEYEKRRQKVHKEVVENSCLPKDLAGIVSEYVVYPKKEKTK